MNGGRTASGLQSSSIKTGEGNDTIEINATAEGFSGYSYTSGNKYINNYENKGSSRYSNSYDYARSYGYNSSWYHNEYIDASSSSSQGESNYEDSRVNESASGRENSQSYRFGSSIGAQDSSIELGNGNNDLSINSLGGHNATALKNSSIRSGSGNDDVEISSVAEGNQAINTQTSGIIKITTAALQMEAGNQKANTKMATAMDMAMATGGTTEITILKTLAKESRSMKAAIRA